MTTYADRLIPRTRPDGSPVGVPQEVEKAGIIRETSATDWMRGTMDELRETRSLLRGIQERIIGHTEKVPPSAGGAAMEIQAGQPSLLAGMCEMNAEARAISDLARSILVTI